MPQQFELELTGREQIAPHTIHLTFKQSNGERFDYIPGQFVTFPLEREGKRINRSYSVACPPGGETIELAIALVEGGAASTLFNNMQIGDTVKVNGFFGRLVLKDEAPKRLFLVATGTGVTPYRAMLPEITRRLKTQDLKVIVLFGARTPEEILYHEEFRAFADAHPLQFSYHACLSREQPDPTPAHIHAGYVQKQLMALEPVVGQDLVYLCGNPAMIDEAFDQLTKLGFPMSDVRREKYLLAR